MPGSPDHAAPTIADSRATAPFSHLNPGATLASRYRIVTHLGKGGMGEVYRADDLTLGVSVALKFLPLSLAADPVRLDRFKAEVRTARQISHPNICRVFDFVEADATSPRPFITMEYVDGEDLASLLRRIGRLPHDKAVQIARQFCFGLAAAHEVGIIHRDLKPANIMLDGRGNARIMDFGIAVPVPPIVGSATVGAPAPHHPRAGTPGYMSPEQFAGKEITPRSDLYSLGLVLYELFTGRPALDDHAIAELTRDPGSATTRTSSITRPSQLTPDLDPAVERTILRCLEPEPSDRPASAIAVAASLPGGDPLAAALAAGETPSPELVAASGAAPTLTPLQAWGRAAAIAAMLAVLIIITASWTMVARVRPAKSPEVLQDRAAQIVQALGYTDAPADSARGLSPRDAYIQRVNINREITDKVAALRDRPGAYEFWYRQSPALITPPDPSQPVRATSPYPSRPGEVSVRTDPSGHLELFIALAPRRLAAPAPPELPDATITRLFEFADLDPSRFTPADPVFRPFSAVDSMRSWTGSLPDRPDLPLRVHLGVADGKVAYFNVAYPWTVASLETRPPPPKPTTLLDYASGAILLLLIAGSCLLAFRNLRAARGDRPSAFRISVAVFLIALAGTLFALHRLPPFRLVLFQGAGVADAVFFAVEIWIFYVAVEPYARRVYPQALVSWTRLLRGSITDPLVGRHILLGMAIGAASAMCTGLFALAIRTFVWQQPMIAFYGRTGGYLGGPRTVASNTADALVSALMLASGSMLLLVTGTLIFKRRWAGYLLLAIALTAIDATGLLANPLEGVAGIVIAMIPLLAIRAGGFLALVVTHATILLAQMLPVGPDWTHWLTAPAFIPASLLAALCILAARAASAGRSFAL